MNNKHTTLVLRITLALVVSPAITFLAGSASGWAGFALSALVAAGVTVAIGWIFDRHDARLTARVEGEVSGEWEAHLNGVRLGVISDADYAAIQRATFRDGDVPLLQARVLVRVAVRVFNQLALGVPILVFWIGIGLLILAPDSCIAFARSLEAAGPSEIVAMATKALELCFFFVLITIGCTVAMGNRFGFRNCYADSVSKLLCQHFKTPATGEVTVWRMVQFHKPTSA